MSSSIQRDFIREGEENTGSTELASLHRQSNRVTMNEATARIKINKLLEAAGWHFFADGNKPANICLETGVTIKASDLDPLGDDFEKTSTGFIDFLLLDAKDFPTSFWKPSRRRRTRSSARSRPANTPVPSIAASSSCRTATCITSGIWNVATPMSSPPSRRRNRYPATGRSRPTRSA